MKQKIQNVLSLLGTWLLILVGVAAAFLIELLNLFFTEISRLMEKK